MQRDIAALLALPGKCLWMDSYMLSKPGAVKEVKESWEAVLYRVRGKIFGLLFRDNRDRLILNLKCEPYLALWYRTQYPHIAAGYHMNKLHWNSVYLEGDTPDEAVRELLDMSYVLVCNGLPRRVRAELGRSGCGN